MKDVICIGSATLDIFIQSDDFKVMPTNDGVVLCEQYGAKLDVKELNILSGGGATNASVTFKRQGLDVGLIAEIGDDLPGQSILQDLSRFKINTNWIIQEADEKTAVSVVLVANEGGRSIVNYRGASRMLGTNDIPWDQLEAKWLYITSLGGNMELLTEITRFAHNHNLSIAINPGKAELEHTQEIYRLAPYWHILFINEDEAALLTGKNTQDLELLAVSVQNFGSANTVITAGNRGAFLVSNESRLHCPASSKKPIEVTGAGDAFGSGLVSGLILGYDLTKSMQLASANAEGVITQIGAKGGIITNDEFQASEKITILNW